MIGYWLEYKPISGWGGNPSHSHSMCIFQSGDFTASIEYKGHRLQLPLKGSLQGRFPSMGLTLCGHPRKALLSEVLRESSEGDCLTHFLPSMHKPRQRTPLPTDFCLKGALDPHPWRRFGRTWRRPSSSPRRGLAGHGLWRWSTGQPLSNSQ